MRLGLDAVHAAKTTVGRSKSKWGKCSLNFDLPVSPIQLQGISAQQKQALMKDYPAFTSNPGEDGTAADVTKVQTYNKVHAYRLNQAPSCTAESMTRAGQYSPQKKRDESGIAMTGINFVAQVESRLNQPPLSLGVANESELVQANVIENFLRVHSAYQVLPYGGVLLHSAGLVIDKKAYIFVGRSGVGKTTLTRKAHKYGAKVLSDDINMVIPLGDQYHAHAVPFSGEFGRTLHQAHDAKSYPVAGIFLLEQASKLAVLNVSKSVAVARLLSGCPFVNEDEHESSSLFDNLTALVGKRCLRILQVRRDDTFEQILALVRDEKWIHLEVT